MLFYVLPQTTSRLEDLATMIARNSYALKMICLNVISHISFVCFFSTHFANVGNLLANVTSALLHHGSHPFLEVLQTRPRLNC